MINCIFSTQQLGLRSVAKAIGTPSSIIFLAFEYSFIIREKGVPGSKTPVTFEFTNNPGEEFDRLWFTGPDDSIIHTRGYDHFGDVWGDLDGTLFYDGDINLNVVTLDGAGGGTAIFTVAYGELSGTFEGRMTLKVRAGIVTGTYMGHGDGDFDGMHLRFKFTGALGGVPAIADGVIIN